MTRVFVVFLLSATAFAGAPKPRVLSLGDNERVLHVINVPFSHVYCHPNLETTLRKYYGHRGLTYRRVVKRTGELVKELDGLLAVYRPTLVIIQTGCGDISRQYRRKVFDFAKYPKDLETVMKKLAAKKVRVVLCSTTPVGPETRKFEPQYERLKEWADAARRIAKQHGALFVDLYTGAVGLPTIGGAVHMRYYHDPKGHARLWDLFRGQVAFQPPACAVSVNARTGAATADGAEVADVKAAADRVSLVVKGKTGALGLDLKATNLADGKYRVMVGKRAAAQASAQDLAKGVDLGVFLGAPRPADRTWRNALTAVHRATEAIGKTANYRLPNWVKSPDFEAQKRAAVAKKLKDLDALDAKAQALVKPPVIKVRIERAR